MTHCFSFLTLAVAIVFLSCCCDLSTQQSLQTFALETCPTTTTTNCSATLLNSLNGINGVSPNMTRFIRVSKSSVDVLFTLSSHGLTLLNVSNNNFAPLSSVRSVLNATRNIGLTVDSAEQLACWIGLAVAQNEVCCADVANVANATLRWCVSFGDSNYAAQLTRGALVLSADGQTLFYARAASGTGVVLIVFTDLTSTTTPTNTVLWTSTDSTTIPYFLSLTPDGNYLIMNYQTLSTSALLVFDISSHDWASLPPPGTLTGIPNTSPANSSYLRKRKSKGKGKKI
jgi:hypothetical protein